MKTQPSALPLNPEQRILLARWIRSQRTPRAIVKRCQIVLGKADGLTDALIAKKVGVNRHTCRLWRQRFLTAGLASLWTIAKGRGRKPQRGLERRIVEATLGTMPVERAQWSTRSLAKVHGVHASTVARIWQKHGLRPNRTSDGKGRS